MNSELVSNFLVVLSSEGLKAATKYASSLREDSDPDTRSTSRLLLNSIGLYKINNYEYSEKYTPKGVAYLIKEVIHSSNTKDIIDCILDDSSPNIINEAIFLLSSE